MGRHVEEMAGIGNEVAQSVRCAQRPFGRRRHLHEVDIHVQEARMAVAASAHGRLEHLDRLGVSAPSAGLPVSISQSCQGVRFISASANSAGCRGRRDGAVYLAHRRGIVVVPGSKVSASPGSPDNDARPPR